VVRLDERSAKLAFKLVPFVALLIAGVWLLVLASATVGIDGEGTIFYPPLGIPGIVAVLGGAIGIFLVALTR
jgi:hypothetical protein